jgi:hypothetical protein
MNYYEPLDISTKPLTLEGHTYLYYSKKLKNNGCNSFRITLDIDQHIDPAVSKFLSQHGLYIRFAELFYSAPNRTSLIHSDGSPDEYEIVDNMAKINFISGGADSVMNWYQPIVKKQYAATGKDNKFISFTPNEVKCIASKNISGYNIAQTGIPHNIVTRTQSRYCVSLTLAIKDMPPKMIPYDKMVSLIKDAPV